MVWGEGIESSSFVVGLVWCHAKKKEKERKKKERMKKVSTKNEKRKKEYKNVKRKNGFLEQKLSYWFFNELSAKEPGKTLFFRISCYFEI